MDNKELLYKIAFASMRGVTPAMADEILNRTGSEREFFEMPEAQLVKLCGSSSRIYKRDYRDDRLAKAEAEVNFVTSNRIRAIYYKDAAYPYRLTHCDDAPLMLYGIGDCDFNDSRVVGVVGTRHATTYGLDFTVRLVEDLAAKVGNVIIVSGLAYGIDIAAHRAALKAGVPTVAVLAHGLNTIYPAEHRKSAADIVRQGGMLMTDYMSSDKIHKGNFVARNRIVAGLCDCIVVAESASRGGALITAEIASQYNRDVFALPGRTTDRYSAGCNRIIAANTAQLVTSAEDVAAAMRWPIRQTDNIQLTLPLDLSEDENSVIAILTDRDTVTISQFTAKLGWPITKLMNMLIDMEFRGLVSAIPGGSYRLGSAMARS